MAVTGKNSVIGGLLSGVLMFGACTIVFMQTAAAAPPATAMPAPESPVPETPPVIHPEIWPEGHSGVKRDPAIEAKIVRILRKMTLEEKVGQVIQADVASVTPADVKKYHLGSVLNGGNSGPYNNDRALAPVWLKEADEFYAASMDVPKGRVAIPVIWGSDAVHGNSNIIGATLFPHNIGLGATDDPELLKEIGAVTAKELRVIGQDWTFAPTIAVVRDDRWGRTYESYGEDPTLVSTYAAAIITGIQGKPGSADFLKGPHVIATAKHFLGDGGTDKGHDQGNNLYDEDGLRDIFSPPYRAAIGAGVQTVMASYSSWQGEKMHGNKALLTDVLVDRYGLDGFVVGDWNGHGQVPGCSPSDCPAAFNAGLDMFMAPDGWKALYGNTLAEVKSGVIPMARLDQAVSRILRVKLRSGLMSAGKPSARPFGGKFDLLGAPAHRAIARRAVRESLVLLKNDGVLPLKPSLHVLVGGDGADDMSKQSGGWTISWQGTGNVRSDFPNAQTIFEGITETVQKAGGSATLSVDGSFTQKPDVAIIVFGENPYAEFQGDRDDLAFEPGDAHDLALLQRLKAQGIPVVAVFLSGRPMYVTREINAANAFVAAWLPGSEGGGISDVLFRKPDGSVNFDFHGKLSFSWPRSPDQTPLNVGDVPYDPLFAYGYGLRYSAPQDIGVLPEAADSGEVAINIDHYLQVGRAAPPFVLNLAAADGSLTPVNRAPLATPDGTLSIARSDHLAQEDTLVATWSGGGAASLVVSGQAIDLSRQTNGDMALVMDLRVDQAPTAPVHLEMACGDKCAGSVDITDALRSAKGWTRIAVRLSCLRGGGAQMDKVTTPFRLTTSGKAVLSLGAVRLMPGEGAPVCPVSPAS
ncbi:MAG TPA: exo 1,3/1,4-beta-D-glucan glucohydrolase [Rhizomicrobium sp.]